VEGEWVFARLRRLFGDHIRQSRATRWGMRSWKRHPTLIIPGVSASLRSLGVIFVN
jgi:hypothetical protein